MNKVFKVIWSEARNAYVVVSEIAKNHGSKSCSTKKLLTMLIATGVMTCASMAPAMAANPASDDLNVTIGKGAHVSVWNGVSGQTISGDIAVGQNAHAWNGEYTYDNKYARIGTKEYLMDFGQGAVETVTDLKWGFWPVTHYKVADGSKIAGSIAIGKNMVARTGSVMLGDHSYTGKLGDIEINPANAMTYNDGIYSTTLGAGAYNSGSLAAVTGALSIASGSDTKNTGATIYGSMNSIESETSSSSYSGVASSVLGFANRTQNANAALIWGTGNEVTNSIEKVGIDTNWNNVSVAEAQQKAIKAMQSSDYAGGSVMAIGGGNKADYAKYSQLTGVKNKVTGTEAKAAKYDFVNGYQNTVTEASDVTVIGIKNKVTADGNKVIGDNHKVSGKDNVIFGSADQLTETTVNNAVVLGHNAKVTGEGGVALGAGSVADRANAVSVGSKGAERQIINVAAGTADTDAVNVSQLNAVATEAGKHTTLSNGKNTTVESTVKDGQTDYKVNVAGDLTDITSVANGDSKINLNKDSIIISNGNKYFAITNSGIGMSYIGADYSAKSIMLGENGTTISGGLNVAGSKITGVAAGVADTDAVNVSQLHAVATEAGKHSKVVSGNNINVEETDVDGQKFYKVNMNKDIILGDLSGKYVNISGTNGTIETTGYIATQDRVYADKGGKLADIDVTGNKISNGASSIVLDGSNVKVNDKVTIDQNGKISGVAAGEVSKTSTDAINGSQLNQTNENVAALDKRVTQNEADIAQNKADIAQNKADIATNKQNIDKLNTRVDGVEKLAKQHTTVTAGDNIAVTETTNKDGGKEYNVALKNKIDLGDKGSVTTGQTEMNNDGLKVGDKVSVTATAVTAGKTSISDEGVKVGDKTYINDKGLNANGQNITNVADGKVEKDSKDAINGGQLHQAKADINNRIDGVENQVISNSNRINQLGSRVNKVGAGAAALAALHPMDFDPDDKLTFSAGYGNYGGENAAAIGAYYRPDEKVMFSVAGTVGNGENMVNAGVSFALDRTNHVSNSRTALAREVIDLRGQLAVMGAKMAKMEKAFGMLDETKTKLFPDVPANHWAYEYIAKLAGNGYIEGYPDGNFGGDRLMTRYEFAAMLYRAIEKGAALEEKIIKEFEPELGRIRVDRISGEDGDRDKIERVRVNDTKGERDHYGNKLAK